MEHCCQRSDRRGLLCALFFFLLLTSLYVSEASPRFEVIADAGSTGTRIYIYSYDDESAVILDTLREVSHLRLVPALSTFYSQWPDSRKLREQIQELVDFAATKVPADMIAHTNISLKATAGLRTIPKEQQDWLVEEVRAVLGSSPFEFHSEKTRVIDGEEESLYDFFAVKAASHLPETENILFNASLSSDAAAHNDNGFVAADLGGSSQQLAFILPSPAPGEAITCRPDWVISTPGGESIDVFAKSLNKLGLIAAMDQVLHLFYNTGPGGASRTLAAAEEKEIFNTASSEAAVAADGSAEGSTDGLSVDGITGVTMVDVAVDDMALYADDYHPCLPPGVFPNNDLNFHGDLPSVLRGSGNFYQCRSLIQGMLRTNNVTSLIDKNCVQHIGKHVIIGLDNFPKALEMLSLANSKRLSPAEIAAKGDLLCRRSWEGVLSDFPGFPNYRAQRACFSSAYIHALLTDVFLVGERDSVFLPLDSIEQERMELAWALGSAALSALKSTVLRV